jgi:3-deoxy-D-manno-octulosonate 8-phosphate phosphatase (KDO 8-P phosphatase)
MSDFLVKLAKIKFVFLDVDGVLTDGSVIITEEGHLLRNMSIKDGYALQLAAKKGVVVCVISGGNSQGVVKRLNALGITDVYLGVSNKMDCFESIVSERKMEMENCLYVGDDIPDIAVMQLCGLAACPADASHEVKAISDYISSSLGGKGCVRDIFEKLLRIQKQWNDEDDNRS